MKNLRFVLVIVFILLSLASCNLLKKQLNNLKNTDKHGHSQNCIVISESTHPSIWQLTKNTYLKIIDFKNKDTVVSIGVGSGSQEFLFSIFTDSITFYMEDIDTSCITCEKIKNKYLPYYSVIRGSNITNSFIPASGTDTTINVKNNVADKVLIFNVYHHFSNDIAMVKECKRILKPKGKIFIDEAVMNSNKFSYKFCDYGGHYKSENNFVKDIVDIGFKCDTIYRDGKYSRIFVFSKQ